LPVLAHGWMMTPARSSSMAEESAPASNNRNLPRLPCPHKITVLLALTANLFDPVPLDQMTDAGHAVCEAAATIPAEVSARFETATKLSDEDKNAVVEIARKALAPFQPKPEPKPEVKPEAKPAAKVETKRENKTEAKPKPDDEAKPEVKVETKPKVESPLPAEVKPSAKVDDPRRIHERLHSKLIPQDQQLPAICNRSSAR